MSKLTRVVGLSSIIAVITAMAAPASAQTPLTPAKFDPIPVTITVNADKVTGKIDARRLGGTNVALWNSQASFASPLTHQWLSAMHPALIRIPGGSWSDITYWNGNGVRGADGKVDASKVGSDGYPAVDYSAYAPTFTANPDTLAPEAKGFSGNVDVKTQHEFVKSVGAQALVCTNAGTGRAVDAAEWVRWARKMGYKVGYWEVGNELDGGWEAGHALPHGKGTLTGEMYAKRFVAFARAMKAVDSSAQVGGATTGAQPGSFSEAMLRDAGPYVDFVSIHTYLSVGGKTDDQALDEIDHNIAQDTGQVRKWIAQYQPQRTDHIKLAYSEYNISTGSSDLFSALWESEFLAGMARNGVSFATEWDAFTQGRGEPDGQALILGDGDSWTRKGTYYALWLWNNYMGDRLVDSTATGSAAVRVLASRSGDAVVLMLLNPDRDREAHVTVNLTGMTPATVGERAQLTGREYFWNPLTHAPDWSSDPRIEKIPTGPSMTTTLPPQSVTYLRIPSSAAPALTALATAAKPSAGLVAAPALRIVLPKQIYAGDKVEGWVEALTDETDHAYPIPLQPADLTTSQPGILDRPQARLAESLGRFFIQPSAPGPLTITAKVSGVAAQKTVTVLASVPKPVYFWDFTAPDATNKDEFSSDWSLNADYSVRPNKAVARINFPAQNAAAPGQGKQSVLMLKKLPSSDKLNLANIRGVVFDLMTSADFATDDSNASLQVVMQSPNDYWMVLGSVPLSDPGKWHSEEMDMTDPRQIANMPTAMNVWFVLRSNKPVKGSIFIDHAGFMVR